MYYIVVMWVTSNGEGRRGSRKSYAHMLTSLLSVGGWGVRAVILYAQRSRSKKL